MKRGIMRHPYGKPMQNFIAKAENSDADNGTYDKHDDPGWAKVFEKVDDRTFKMHLTQPYGAVVTHGACCAQAHWSGRARWRNFRRSRTLGRTTS